MQIKEKIILALETSQKAATIAILKDKNPIAVVFVDSTEKVSEVILKKIDELLMLNDLKLSDIDLIAVSLGPGSMNGIRVGIAIAQGLAFSRRIRCCGISLFEAAANHFQEPNGRFLAGYRHRQNYYWQLFTEEGNSSSVESGSENDFQKATLNCKDHFLIPSQNEDTEQGDVNLAVLVGLKAFELADAGIETSLSPVYLEGTNFRKLSFE